MHNLVLGMKKARFSFDLSKKKFSYATTKPKEAPIINKGQIKLLISINLNFKAFLNAKINKDKDVNDAVNV